VQQLRMSRARIVPTQDARGLLGTEGNVNRPGLFDTNRLFPAPLGFIYKDVRPFCNTFRILWLVSIGSTGFVDLWNQQLTHSLYADNFATRLRLVNVRFDPIES
jgi:hypothetical protein